MKCEKCTKKGSGLVSAVIGSCNHCGGFVPYARWKLCEECSLKLKQCTHCLANI